MLLQDILRETKFRKQRRIFLKIDFEKACDKVNNEFLFDCCKQKDFRENLMTWIRKVVIKETLSVRLMTK
jgi:hypothetical protein